MMGRTRARDLAKATRQWRDLEPGDSFATVGQRYRTAVYRVLARDDIRGGGGFLCEDSRRKVVFIGDEFHEYGRPVSIGFTNRVAKRERGKRLRRNRRASQAQDRSRSAQAMASPSGLARALGIPINVRPS